MSKTKFITTTALMIAVTVVLQLTTSNLPLGAAKQFVTGSCVNMCLIISAGLAGLWSGAAVGVVTPFIALALSLSQPFFTPFIAIGNALLVTLYSLLKEKKILSLIVPAAVKFVFLFVSINIMVRVMQLPEPSAAAMSFAFGWPQAVTALIGTTAAMLILPGIKKAILK
ncbi:MAG: ECF transporter S component [Clostridia bacterium]|nr:ECF transporter S component [Clostridia bacterium]